MSSNKDHQSQHKKAHKTKKTHTYICLQTYTYMFTFLLSNINLCPMTFVLKDKLVPNTLPGLRNV